MGKRRKKNSHDPDAGIRFTRPKDIFGHGFDIVVHTRWKEGCHSLRRSGNRNSVFYRMETPLKFELEKALEGKQIILRAQILSNDLLVNNKCVFVFSVACRSKRKEIDLAWLSRLCSKAVGRFKSVGKVEIRAMRPL